ncbi:Chaperone protein htpG family protein [Raphanus sativus]|nr:Chaperone protein htpG family protein [Raphanus sativus]
MVVLDKEHSSLHVKRVFVSDDFDGELLPRYLSFVKSVVDSNDLHLNVSREILQESKIVRIMRERLIRERFDMIQEISESENKEDYNKFWENFGRLIKLGCIEDTGDEDEVKEREAKQTFNLLCDWMKQQLGDKVAKVLSLKPFELFSLCA